MFVAVMGRLWACRERSNSRLLQVVAVLLCVINAVHALHAQSADTTAEASPTAAKPGHSFHAEAFNEGPRQAAYLMQGMGNVHWPTSTPSPMAQRFFDQGLAQLHGFWYFEAERSFRQAAAIDPECAIHYWGMARANIENPERSAGFIEQAKRRIDSASKVERRLIDAWQRRVQDWPNDPAEASEAGGETSTKKPKSRDVSEETDQKRKQRLRDYAKDLEELALDYPNDIEIKAMLVLQFWQNQGAGIEIQSHAAIDALLSEIFRMNPRHPAHHFRIHLWDYRKEDLALTAAALCGPSVPGIAHMWHMPGHTYSRLHRYEDAAWQQEASARVDHAHMIRDGVMPDQIHNYAHNNEWLIRNWIHLGRAEQAISLAKNMIELPRHPQYNDPETSGSASYGRQRLLTALTSFQRWELLRSLCDSVYLKDDANLVNKDSNDMWRAIANAHLGQQDVAELELRRFTETRQSLRNEISSLTTLDASAERRPPTLIEPPPAPEDLFGSENDPSLPEKVNKEFDENRWKDKPDEVKKREREKHDLSYRYYRLGIAVAAIESHLAAAKQDYRYAVQRSNDARSVVDNLQRIEWTSLAGEHALAAKKVREAMDASQGQVLPAALAVWVAHEALRVHPSSSSAEEWKTLRQSAIERCANMAYGCDSDWKWLDRAKSIAGEIAPQLEWGETRKLPLDLGDRPTLDSLGPVRWSPPIAPSWNVSMPNGEERSSKQLHGKPYVVILYLGFGCLHCAEQLAAFSPEVTAFREAGIEVIGVSTEDRKSLMEGLSRYDQEMHIPLASNSDLDVFKAFRCFDDFEGQPLHGTILVDGQGRIRWQDIGHQPFMDVGFVLRESKRLLQLP